MNRKLLLLIGCLIAAGGLLAKGTKPQAPAQPSGLQNAPRKAEEQFKNIQVLKGVPAEQIFPTMQFITASLGVECDFCHVQNAFEKDDKKNKQTARKMMEMMFAINKDNFDSQREVTCYSCHRGNAKPAAIPAVMTEDSKEPVAAPHRPEGETKPPDAKESSGPTAGQLLDKYLQAAGGTAIDKVTSRVMKGTIDFGGKSFPIDIYAKDPQKRVSFTHMPDSDSVTAFDGHDGWLGTPGHPLREMHGSDLDGAAIDADLHLAAHLKQMFTELQTRGTEKIGDSETYVVVGQRQGKPPIRLYLDQQSGLLVRLVRFGDTALGLLPTQIDYADYRDVSGVKVPYRWTLARPSGRFTIQLTDLQQNVAVDDARFAKPPAPPEQPKAK
ncbi:MAG TPA: c-type cytochrome [Candidatus Dormibacteraeota bacterium]|nr:c-type cytochrome [Candidatus Dormibacteraeota bacterium]